MYSCMVPSPKGGVPVSFVGLSQHVIEEHLCIEQELWVSVWKRFVVVSNCSEQLFLFLADCHDNLFFFHVFISFL